ncbi:MAG: carboxypeptidase regulatory-like domain-containing protein, partial [Myxococcales bacterium]|nr:carboxypeptidase regulatory-like domain-containing protein [Myxococcales bacterium]
IQAGAPGSTPPLDKPATAADGFVEARVLAQGKPLQGAHVRLYFRGHADRNTAVVDWRFAGGSDTGRDGIARIPARPGSYLAAARSGSFAPARIEFHRPAGEKTTKVALELRAGIALTGKTVQKGGTEPVPLALVTLTFGGGRGSSPAEEQARATADSQGRFRIDGLEPVRYAATAQATGYAKATARVDASITRDLTIELAAAAFIEGRVLAADGSPAGGAEVFASGGADAVAGTASETGAFSLEVSPRTWTVSARRGDESGRADAPVTVAAGATARNVTIKLGASSGIAGVVVGALSQQPVPGAQIAVSPHGSNGDSGRAVSGPDGAFAVGGLPPGSYDVAATADGYTDVIRGGVTVDQGQRFPLKIEMHATGSVTGVVRDSAGRGVPFALVRSAQQRMWQATAAALEARADESGAYQLTGLSPGDGSFTALRDGSSAGTVVAAEVPEGGSARLDFQLHDEGVVTGHVRREDGSPAPADVSVVLFPTGSRFRPSGSSNIPIDASGVYVASVPAGAYSAMVNSPRGGAGLRNARFVTVEAGQTATQDLVYVDPSDTTGFSGTVLEPDGTPSPGAFVRANTEGAGRNMAFAVNTDESGRFQSGRLRADLPDSFSVVAINGARTGTAAVAPSQTEVTVALQPAATLRGHLATGPVDSFRVDVRADRSPPQSLEFTGDRFEMRDIPGLAVHVTVTTQDGRSARLDVTLSPGAVQDVEIPLQPLATVTGRLLDSNTQLPVTSVQLFVDSPSRTDVRAGSGPEGRFQLTAPAGDHTLRGFAPLYNPLAKSFTVQAGQRLDLGDVAIDRQTAQAGTIGMSMRGDSDTPPTVVYLIPDGPADRAGVHLGDQVMTVDGTAVSNVADATSRIRGTPATPVQIVFQRSGQALSLTIQRAP